MTDVKIHDHWYNRKEVLMVVFTIDCVDILFALSVEDMKEVVSQLDHHGCLDWQGNLRTWKGRSGLGKSPIQAILKSLASATTMRSPARSVGCMNARGHAPIVINVHPWRK